MSECLGGTHLPIGWEEIRDWFTKPRKGREWKENPAQERKGELLPQEKVGGKQMKWEAASEAGFGALLGGTRRGQHHLSAGKLRQESPVEGHASAGQY